MIEAPAPTKRLNSQNGTSNLSLYGSEKTLKVTIRMSEQKERNQLPGAIFYKDDEARFAQQYTLKLKTDSKYNITMEIEPTTEIRLAYCSHFITYASNGDEKNVKVLVFIIIE